MSRWMLLSMQKSLQLQTDTVRPSGAAGYMFLPQNKGISVSFLQATSGRSVSLVQNS